MRRPLPAPSHITVSCPAPPPARPAPRPPRDARGPLLSPPTAPGARARAGASRLPPGPPPGLLPTLRRAPSLISLAAPALYPHFLSCPVPARGLPPARRLRNPSRARPAAPFDGSGRLIYSRPAAPARGAALAQALAGPYPALTPRSVPEASARPLTAPYWPSPHGRPPPPWTTQPPPCMAPCAAPCTTPHVPPSPCAHVHSRLRNCPPFPAPYVAGTAVPPPTETPPRQRARRPASAARRPASAARRPTRPAAGCAASAGRWGCKRRKNHPAAPAPQRRPRARGAAAPRAARPAARAARPPNGPLPRAPLFPLLGPTRTLAHPLGAGPPPGARRTGRRRDQSQQARSRARARAPPCRPPPPAPPHGARAAPGPPPRAPLLPRAPQAAPDLRTPARRCIALPPPLAGRRRGAPHPCQPAPRAGCTPVLVPTPCKCPRERGPGRPVCLTCCAAAPGIMGCWDEPPTARGAVEGPFQASGGDGRRGASSESPAADPPPGEPGAPSPRRGARPTRFTAPPVTQWRGEAGEWSDAEGGAPRARRGGRARTGPCLQCGALRSIQGEPGTSTGQSGRPPVAPRPRPRGAGARCASPLSRPAARGQRPRARAAAQKSRTHTRRVIQSLTGSSSYSAFFQGFFFQR
jgi:hypothetical protein